MEKINITRKIVLKQLVTENFKKKAVSDLQSALKQAEVEMEHFDKQYRKMITEFTVKGLPQADELKAQYQAEKERKTAMKQQLSEQFKAAQKLELGSEIVHSIIDGPAEVKVGDNFDGLNRHEIVLEDGIVKEIR